ncbi:hypothetical protein BDK51DRAFT_36702 [Blyttiomyces helicus]|uniref:Uncharacterized protein n=1 Tax=Blyttiomyces helicus TaxID=388810 RepID=A0A4P9WAD7_9FUNG|nr:hypothetical protein BDK51DRAFT_36702 [Blyttiomyces helicus]|eukprot:RKO88515.1 hypothetical protein BDK51DRAFT_36702 [Blyttiomyces helicus]
MAEEWIAARRSVRFTKRQPGELHGIALHPPGRRVSFEDTSSWERLPSADNGGVRRSASPDPFNQLRPETQETPSENWSRSWGEEAAAYEVFPSPVLLPGLAEIGGQAESNDVPNLRYHPGSFERGPRGLGTGAAPAVALVVSRGHAAAPDAEPAPGRRSEHGVPRKPPPPPPELACALEPPTSQKAALAFASRRIPCDLLSISLSPHRANSIRIRLPFIDSKPLSRRRPRFAC